MGEQTDAHEMNSTILHIPENWPSVTDWRGGSNEMLSMTRDADIADTNWHAWQRIDLNFRIHKQPRQTPAFAPYHQFLIVYEI